MRAFTTSRSFRVSCGMFVIAIAAAKNKHDGATLFAKVLYQMVSLGEMRLVLVRASV